MSGVMSRSAKPALIPSVVVGGAGASRATRTEVTNTMSNVGFMVRFSATAETSRHRAGDGSGRGGAMHSTTSEVAERDERGERWPTQQEAARASRDRKI